MLVSLGIIALLSTMILANYRDSTRANSLNLAAQQLISDIRSAQNNTLGSTPYNNQTSQGGWGIHFEKGANNYVIFADLNENKIYGPTEEGNVDYGARNVILPKNIIIDNIVCSTCNDNVDVTFLPPDPITNIFSAVYNPTATTTSSFSATSTLVRIKDSITGKTKTVFVNFFGLIDNEN